MDLKLTLIALAARHVIGRTGRRPGISWHVRRRWRAGFAQAMKVAIVCADTGTVGQRIAELLLNAKPGEVTIIPADLAVAWQTQIADRTAPAILSIRKRERHAWATLRNMVLD